MIPTGRISGMILAVLVAWSCATAPAPETVRQQPASIQPFLSVPFSFTPDGLYQVNVRINGEGPFPFILDTGATISVLYESTAARLNLEVSPDETTTVHGILASATRPIILLDELSVGTLTKSSMRVTTLEDSRANPGIAGILGLDFLQDHALVFDPGRMELDFTVSEQFQAREYRSWNLIRLNPNPYTEEDHGLVFIYMTFAGYRNPAILDTGSSTSAANWAAAQSRQLRSHRDLLRERAELEGAIGTFRPRVKVKVYNMFAGEQTWGERFVMVLDLGTLNIIGAEGKPLIIAGADLFRDYTWAIDFSGKRLYLKPDANESGEARTRRPAQVTIEPVEGDNDNDKDENGN